eukprot:tig00021179_g19228.t1
MFGARVHLVNARPAAAAQAMCRAVCLRPVASLAHIKLFARATATSATQAPASPATAEAQATRRGNWHPMMDSVFSVDIRPQPAPEPEIHASDAGPVTVPLHPLLANNIVPRCEKTMTAAERVYCFITVHAAQGNLKALVEDWKHLDVKERRNALEIILQTELFAGIPRVINALGAVQKAMTAAERKAVHAEAVAAEEAMKGTPTEQSLNAHVWWTEDGVPEDKRTLAEWENYESSQHDFLKEGVNVFGAVYGNQMDRVKAHLFDLHPALADWVLECGYGRLLGRPGPSLRIRELCAVSVLAGQSVNSQLTSHIRGSMRAGATEEEVDAVIEQTKALWGPAAYAEAKEVWDAFRAAEAAKKAKAQSGATPVAAAKAQPSAS